MTYPTTLQTPDSFQGTTQQSNSAILAIQTDFEKKLVSWATQEYRKIKNARRSIERQWYINLAFYFGKQNIAVVNTAASPSGFRLTIPKAPPWRVRLIINKIRKIIRTQIAKTVAQKPRFYVVPASTEDEDLVAARVGEQIFDSVYADKKIKTVIRRAEWWAAICGTGFIKDYWDPNKLSTLGDKGDFCIEPTTPFHVFIPNFDTEELEEQPYVIHVTTKSVDWVRMTYPQLSKVEADVNAASDILNDSFMGMIGAQSPDSKNSVLCIEVWIKPKGHPLFPSGGMFQIVGGRIVYLSNKYPYKHGEFPFSKLEHIPSGKFYGTSVIEDLISPQREYNRTRSQIVENKNRMAKLQLVAPRGSIEASKVTSEPGQVIFYTPGFNPPTPLTLQGLPSYVLQEVDRLQQDMDDISGQHEISRGQNPAQVTAATALSYLQEQDDTQLSDTIESLESAVEKLGRHVLSHASQYWTEGRMIRVVGRDQSFDAHVYKTADLGGNNDLRVESGSALPTSKAAKQAFLMDLIKLGAIQINDALQVLDIGGIEKVYEDFLVDKRQAQRENLKLGSGLSLPPNDWDNHQVHIMIHNKYRKTQEYEALPNKAKEDFQQHVELHKAAMAAAMPPPDQQDPNANPGQPSAQPDSMAPQPDMSQPPAPMPGG